jgi:hypothetical protein
MFRVKNNILIAGIFCISLLLATGSLSQAEDHFCTGVVVVQAGAKVSGTQEVAKNSVLLKNTRSDCGNWAQNTNLWFYLAENNQNSMLAAALTSLAVKSKVTVVSKAGNVYVNWGTLTLLTASAPE